MTFYHISVRVLNKPTVIIVWLCLTPPGPSKPNFPDQFQTRIELTIINKNQTTELVEYYDGANNRGTIQQTDFNINLRAIYDYVNDEFIMDFPDERNYAPCIYCP